ncbi:hypothetical protein DYBT9275_03670 [Dyadobacter sp. CECT 9275]|uniref:T9SS type A sorting domain-containing protein n=1 Tax=Dyadobacter helix TaxID=2822344 RepID=A0A916ND43_9BACT|nr:T9SS type A sorting domain-containing protein [Dyadobacter sp. CECT 9275]CAG5005863.1 hypothetical protein DYBT9275_03670 [Dyadobacter sp. CECT 9275]
MKHLYPFFLVTGLLICPDLKAQSAHVLKSDLKIRAVHKIENTDLQVRLRYSPTNDSFYTIDLSGGLHHLVKNADGTFQNSRVSGVEDHGINYLQGLAIRDGWIYLAGNVVIQQGVSGYGKAVKAQIRPGLPFLWVEIFRTEAHASSKTLFDHSFSAICFSADGKDIYISSGSRTDHGEVKNNEGLYPNLREVALTSAIYKLPAGTEKLFLPNDSASLAPYIFVRGVRNAFGLAVAANGDLFSVENSGERDDPEEMNWIRPGAHYGFPWEIGGNDNPMQFAGYDPEADKLLNHQYTGYKTKAFYDDPAYPKKPAGLVYRTPVVNLGPDADKFRDPVTGIVKDASDTGTGITTFSGHRSPVGLSFDTKNALKGMYTGKGFMLSYQKGYDGYGPLEETGQDLLMLDLKKNLAGDNYELHAFQIAEGFQEPTDSEINGNKIYILEERGQIWEITFPQEIITGTDPESRAFKVYPNLASDKLFLEGPGLNEISAIYIHDITGRQVLSYLPQQVTGYAEMDVSGLQAGIYIIQTITARHHFTKKILISR